MRLDAFAADQTVKKPLLKILLDGFNWDYILDIETPSPVEERWMQGFGTSVDTLDLFPCRRRFTSEVPGWVPIHYRDNRQRDWLSIVIALPPGGLRASLMAYELVRPVFERIASEVFVAPRTKLRFATPIQIESLLDRVSEAPVELSTSFVRDHHRACGELPSWAASD